MAQLNFDAQTVAPQAAFENLPVGWYTVKIVESEMKPSSTQGASYLEIVHEVIAPQEYAGRKLWNRLNLVNPSEIAVKIAYETLSAICHATGIIQCADSQQLHERPMEAKVGMSKVTDQYPEPRNEIKGYRALQGTGAAPGNMGQQQQQMQQQAPTQFQQQQPQQQMQQAQTQPQQQQWGQQQQQVQQQPEQQQQQVQQQVQQEQPQQQWQQQQQQQVQNNDWAQQQPQQAEQPQQQQVQQEQPQQIETAQQPATDANAQEAAATNKPPWQQ